MQNNMWSYLKGYVNIRIDGLSIEKFINMAISRKIWLKNVRRLSNTSMLATVSIRGFFAIRPIARKLKLKISIVDKNGYPFLLGKVKKRKAFVFGIIFCFAFVIYVSSFVWVIDIHGNERVSTKVIEQVLARYGVKPGTFKYNINPSEIERKLLIDIDDLAWAGVAIQGTRISVSVVEKKKPPAVKEDKGPSNIVASKDAIIDRIITFEGDPVVKDGETVRAGQVLVTGIIQREGAPTRYVHSSAIIDARTWYEEEVMIPIKDSSFINTGNKMENLWLNVNGKMFPIYVRKVPYRYYSKSTYQLPILKYEEKKFPLWIVKETYNEKKLVERSMSLETARKKAEEMAYEKVYKKLPRNAIIISKKVIASTVYNGIARAKVLVEVKEDVTRQEKIEVKEEHVERINDSNR